MREAVIQQDIRLALGQRQDIMMFRINVGKFRPLDGGARVIQSAPEGTPDLLGVITPGRAFAIEVKTEKGKQRLAQSCRDEGLPVCEKDKDASSQVGTHDALGQEDHGCGTSEGRDKRLV